MDQFSQKNVILIAIVVLVIGLAGGYLYGQKKGYSQAETDIKKLDEVAAKKATEEAAKAANPFQAVNPLEGVEANPFQKVKKILNPFE
jgi:cell division protein FtsL